MNVRTPLFYSFWWNGTAAIPTKAEHLRRQRLYVESIALAGREIGLQFALHALWLKSEANPAIYRTSAADLLRQDAAACRAAAQFFRALARPAPWPKQYEAKAAAIDAYLETI